MRRKIAGRAAVLPALLALALWPGSAAAIQLGSTLHDPPDIGLCPTTADGLRATCSFSQLRLDDESSADSSLTSDRFGVITRWRIATGVPSPATAEVQARLRTLSGNRPAAPPSRYRPLPVADPGVHEFPVRMPIEFGQRIGIDVIVDGSGAGVAAAPIGRSAPGISLLDEWIPRPLPVEARPTRRIPDTELLLNVAIENDVDGDGRGDRTQDGCKFDPRRHSACLPDKIDPRVKVRYSRRQPFLARRTVMLEALSNEYGRLAASGQAEFPNSTWGLLGSDAWVHPGVWTRLAVTFERRSSQAAEDLLARGGHPWVRAYAVATDASGNRDGRWNLRIRLPGS